MSAMRLQSALTAIIAILMGAMFFAGCRSAPADVPVAEKQESPQPVLIGFWIDGLELFQGERYPANVGIIVHGKPGIDASDAKSLLLEMEHSPIVGTFRSSREAHVVAKQLQEQLGNEVHWIHSTYSGTWTFKSEPPPLKDPNGYHEEFQVSADEVLEYERAPIGNWSAGILYSTFVYVLPYPLETRGVCVTIGFPKGRALPRFFPADCNASIFTTWESTNAALRGAGTYSVTRWRDGTRVRDDRTN